MSVLDPFILWDFHALMGVLWTSWEGPAVHHFHQCPMLSSVENYLRGKYVS